MLNLANFKAALKDLYPKKKLENMVYMDRPTLALIPKNEKGYGDRIKQPIMIGNPQGRSRTFAKANANKTPSTTEAFYLTRVEDFGIASVDGHVAEASANDEGAFLNAMKSEIDRIIDQCSRNLAISLHGSKSGTIGQVGSIATNVITLKDPNTVVAFELGMTIGASATDGGGTVRTGVSKITAIDRSAGKLTITVSEIASLTANDYLFVDGDYDLSLAGFASWLPVVRPVSGENFFSVDRSKDSTRLAGVVADLSALPILEAVTKGAALVAREGAAVDLCVVNFDTYSDIEIAMGAKVQYTEHKVGEIGFQALKINGPRGVISVIADQDAKDDRMLLLKKDTWTLWSIGGAVKIFNLDGNDSMRENDANAYATRVGGYTQLGCSAPGHNGNFKIK